MIVLRITFRAEAVKVRPRPFLLLRDQVEFTVELDGRKDPARQRRTLDEFRGYALEAMRSLLAMRPELDPPAVEFSIGCARPGVDGVGGDVKHIKRKQRWYLNIRPLEGEREMLRFDDAGACLEVLRELIRRTTERWAAEVRLPPSQNRA